MIVEILPEGGLGHDRPIVLRAASVLVRMDDGTPVMVASVYGPDGSVAVGSVQHNSAEFHRMLKALDIYTTTVIVDRLQLPAPPPGARLVAGPRE